MTGNARLVFLFLAAAILFGVPAAMKDLWRPDEPRYAEVAREMMISGDYLVPHVNGEVYREKPPLLFWLMALASWPVGAVNAFTARVPSIAAALLTMGLTFGLARRMFGERAGQWSAAILATTYRFWWQSNIGQIDMVLTACTTVSLYALWRWHEERKWGWVIVLFVGAALAMLAKGPPALLIVGAGTVVFLWAQGDLPRGWPLYAGLPLAILPVLVWFVLARSATGAEVSQEVSGTLSRQVAGRILTGVTHPQPPWFYLEKFPIEWAPWSLFAPWTLLHAWRTRKAGPGERLILAWTLPALVFFHLIVEKREVYLLPLFPGFAILTARGLITLVDTGRTAWLRATAWLMVFAGLAMVAGPAFVPLDVLPGFRPGPILLAGALTLGWTTYVLGSHARDRWSRNLVDPILLAGTLMFDWTTYVRRARDWSWWPMSLAGLTAMIFFASALSAFPAMNAHKSAKGFCTPARILAHSTDVKTYDLGPMREEFIFYSETFHDYVLSAPGASVLPASKDQSSSERAAGLRSRMAKACGVVNVSAFTGLSTEQRAALQKVRDSALAEAGLSEAEVQAYVEAVSGEIRAFTGALQSDGPAVVIAQRDDWMWVSSFAEAPVLFAELPQGVVSDRPMILLANSAAIDALRRVGYIKD